MTIFGRSIKFFLIFLTLVLIALIVFVATFDANNYKPQIIEQVENATGRDFSIDGDINLSIFPWIGLKVENATLGNEKGFSAKQFASIKQLDIKINVLPLLKKEVEINTIRLHGLDVSLEVDKDKSNNWSTIAQSEVAAGAVTEATATAQTQTQIEDRPTAEKNKALPLQSLKVEGFELVDAVIRYDDRSSNTTATISELNLTSSAIAFDEPVDIKFGARIENSQPVIDTRLNLTTQLTFNKELTTFNLRDVVFTILADANEFIAQQEKVEIKSDIKVSMDDQQVTLKSLRLTALGTTTQADITVTQLLETPLIQGDVEVQPFDARAVAKRVVVQLPEMAKADALKHVALKTKIKLQGEKFEANDVSLTMDSSTLSGWVRLDNISKQQLRYELAFDHLNINDYLPAVAEPVAQEKAVAGVASPGAVADTAAIATTGDEKIVLPLEMMRKLDVQGDFRVAELTAEQYQITQLLITTKASNGIIDISPLAMQVLQGQVKAEVKLDVQKQIPAYTFNLDVEQVQLGPVVNPHLVGLMGDEPLELKGAANVKMAVKTAGDSVNVLKKSSKGTTVLDMNGTTVDGFDPEYYMRSSIAKYIDSKGLGLSETLMGDYQPRKVTVFDTIHSTVILANGEARTDDFLMSAKRVEIKAKGYVDIMKDTVDVTSSIRLPRGKTALEKIFDEPMIVRTHGPFDALKHDIDTDNLKKTTTDVLKNQAKAELKEKVDAETSRAKEKADEALKKNTDKLQDKLKDKFKGLF